MRATMRLLSITVGGLGMFKPDVHGLAPRPRNRRNVSNIIRIQVIDPPLPQQAPNLNEEGQLKH